MNLINFKTTREENILIDKILDRQEKLAEKLGVELEDRLSRNMDLSATHSNGCPLDFQKLLDFPDGPFGHDVFGISRYIDRETGELTGCFLPRCAK